MKGLRPELKDFKARLECIRSSVNAPAPAMPISNGEIIVVVEALIDETRDLRKMIRVLQRTGKMLHIHESLDVD